MYTWICDVTKHVSACQSCISLIYILLSHAFLQQKPNATRPLTEVFNDSHADIMDNSCSH